jgi:hypothetical protein
VSASRMSAVPEPRDRTGPARRPRGGASAIVDRSGVRRRSPLHRESDRILRPVLAGRAEWAPVTGKRWPDLFIAGAPRAGTSSLWDYLSQHPQIFMSRVKEPHFFSDFKPRLVPTVKSESAYLGLFAHASPGQLLGEATPSYLHDPAAPARIARVCPDARIVVVLRDPVTRAYSDYWHKVRYGREARPFLERIQTQLGDEGRRRPGLGYVGAGLYAEPLERYLGTFDGGVLVLFQEELAADTRREVRRILEFLGVEAAVADRIRLGVRNATALPRNALVRRLYRSPALRAAGVRIVPDSLQPGVERLLLRRDGVPPMEPEARRLLREFYASEPAELERLLGRPVPWVA